MTDAQDPARDQLMEDLPDIYLQLKNLKARLRTPMTPRDRFNTLWRIGSRLDRLIRVIGADPRSEEEVEFLIKTARFRREIRDLANEIQPLIGPSR